MGQDLAVDSAPIGTATAGPHAERLSKLVTTQRATVDRDTGLELYRDMTLGRRFEDKCAEMYYRGKMFGFVHLYNCLLYTSPSPRDKRQSRMPSSA